MEADERSILKRIFGFSIVVIGTGVSFALFYCRLYDGGRCTDPDFQLIFGVVIGVITTGGFFYFIERYQQKLADQIKAQKQQLEEQKQQLEEQNQHLKQNNKQLEEIFKTYAARTALISLKVIFTEGDERAPRNDETREKYLKILKKEYLDKYPDHKEKVKQAYDIASLHKVNSHTNNGCNDCKEIVDLINHILKFEVTQPFT